MTPRARTFSQAPQAVRSARGRRRNGTLPPAASARRTLQADECHAIGFTANIHRPGNVSGAAAAQAGFRIHASLSFVKSFSSIRAPGGTKLILLRKTNRRDLPESQGKPLTDGLLVSSARLCTHLPVRQSHTGLPLSSRNNSVSGPRTSTRARITSEDSCLTLEPVTAISSPLLKLMPISSSNVLGQR